MSKLLAHHRCLHLARNDLQNRAYGAMFGFAIGDSLGAYVVNQTFNHHEVNSALLMKGGGAMNLKSGECTDEWEISLALSEALISGKGRYSQDAVA